MGRRVPVSKMTHVPVLQLADQLCKSLDIIEADEVPQNVHCTRNAIEWFVVFVIGYQGIGYQGIFVTATLVDRHIALNVWWRREDVAHVGTNLLWYQRVLKNLFVFLSIQRKFKRKMKKIEKILHFYLHSNRPRLFPSAAPTPPSRNHLDIMTDNLQSLVEAANSLQDGAPNPYGPTWKPPVVPGLNPVVQQRTIYIGGAEIRSVRFSGACITFLQFTGLIDMKDSRLVALKAKLARWAAKRRGIVRIRDGGPGRRSHCAPRGSIVGHIRAFIEDSPVFTDLILDHPMDLWTAKGNTGF